jgi:tetratricopeptide (TPR) repeat protein
MAAASPSSRAWIYGPATDLLLGCGIGYVLLACAMGLLPVSERAVLTAGVLGTFFTGMPHYGATLLRVYERREDRRRYALFTVWASLAVWAAFVGGLYVSWVGSMLLTVYVTWSPWHYTGQNYGIAVMFLRRRGVPLPIDNKRLLYTSFLLSYALSFIAVHGARQEGGYVPFAISGTAYRFVYLGIPAPIHDVLFGALLAAYVVVSGFAIVRLVRGSGLREILPAVLLMVSQSLWFSLPSVALWWSGRAIRGDHVVLAFLWVGIAHSIQYLWITTYYNQRGETHRSRLAYLAKTLMAGAIVFTIPALIFSPVLAGTVSYRLGLFLLVAAAINIQHFILDGAIWKLRDGRVAKILLAAAGAESSDEGPVGPERRWPRQVFWTVGSACLVISVTGAWLYHVEWQPAVATGNSQRAEVAEKWLRRMLRDEPAFYTRRAKLAYERGDRAGAEAEFRRSLELMPTPNVLAGLASLRFEEGDHEGALASYERSLEVQPTANAWLGIGMIRGEQGDGEGAIEAYRQALLLDPNDVTALSLSGQYWVRQGKKRRGERLLARAAELAGKARPDGTDPVY